MPPFNDTVIAEFRANRGSVGHGFGSSLVLVHTVGRKSGQPRVNPAMSLRDGEDWLVIGSAAGAQTHPAWILNLRAQPETFIEVPALQLGVTDIVRIAVVARELEGDERARAFARFEQQSTSFTQYQQRAGERELPIVRFERRNEPTT